MSLFIIFSIPFVFFCILLAMFITLNYSKPKNLPPGPWNLPLIGNLHQFVSSLPPHRTLRNLANQYGPLMHLQLGEKPHIIVSSAEMAKEVMKTYDVICGNRPQFLAFKYFSYDYEGIVFTPCGSKWRHLKKLSFSKVFAMKQVQSFRSIREKEVSELVKNIFANEGSVINLSKEIVILMNTIITRITIGRRCIDQEALLSTMLQMPKLLAGYSIADFYPSSKVLPLLTGLKAKIERLHKEGDLIMENLIKDNRAKNKSSHGEVEGEEEDIIDFLLKTQKKDDLETPLTHKSIKAFIMDMLLGGTGAPSITVIWAMSELMRNPKAMEKAQAEVRKVYNVKGYVDETEFHQLKYLNSVIRETLRLHPPEVLSIPRENSERCVINGYEIPAKSRITINAWAIGRDPKYWTEAERFLPERFLDNPIDLKGTNFAYIPFGAGRRICPAVAFSLPQMLLPLASMLYHFDWKVPNGLSHEEVDMTESFGLITNKGKDLLLIPICYKPSMLFLQ